MRCSLRSSLALLPIVAACAAGSGGDGDTGPAVLAFSMPDEPTVTYTQADTGEVVIDMGGQLMNMDMRSDAVLDLAFAESEAGMRVTTTWRELDAAMTGPMTPPQRLDQDAVEGPLVFTLDARGRVQVVSVPETPSQTGQLMSPTQTAMGLFPRLPGVPPTAGMTWTDTIRYEAEEGGATQAVRILANYTVAGDTTVAGRTLLKVRVDGSQSIQAEGRQQGMRVLQDMNGPVDGYFLWDLATGMMEYQYSETELSGTVDVDAAPYPMDMRVTAVSHVRRTAN